MNWIIWRNWRIRRKNIKNLNNIKNTNNWKKILVVMLCTSGYMFNRQNTIYHSLFLYSLKYWGQIKCGIFIFKKKKTTFVKGTNCVLDSEEIVTHFFKGLVLRNARYGTCYRKTQKEICLKSHALFSRDTL